MQETSLEIVKQADMMMPPADLLVALEKQANYMVAAKMLPPGYDNGPAVVAVALRGREMGCTFWESIGGMFPMKGRVGYMGAFLLAQVRKRLPQAEIIIEESTPTVCKLKSRRTKDEDYQYTEITLNEAKSFNWHQNFKDGGWKPKAVWADTRNMLYWRCVSRVVNRFFSDIFGAPVYTSDELQDADADVSTPIRQEAPPYETAKSEPAPPPVATSTVEVEFPAPTVPEPVVPEVVEPAPKAPTSDGINYALIDWFKNALALCTSKADVDKAFEELRPQANPATMTEAFPIKSDRIKELKSKGVNRA